MASVKGIREKVHMPLYDSISVDSGAAGRSFSEVIGDGRVLRFFVDVQRKTRLDTNMQAASVLSHYNTFEAYAMRVVIHATSAYEQPAAEFLSSFIFNSVTTLIVGEKTMIEMPTFWFPAGAGAWSSGTGIVGHGEPDPLATFRFAEPVFIDKQQNFRVEIIFPGRVPDVVGSMPRFQVWVVLDGYLTRDVQ